ncbi:hypothetical protein OHW04_02075 [Acinetobacter baumannii]|nr:hypothetical protein [Acinetobacter baumannii]
MTDLNKERELCNQSFEKYWDDFCEAYGNGFDRSLAKLFFANAWGEAKAQAVPDTHILIPKEPNRKTIMAMACVCLGAVGSDPEFLTLKDAKDVYSALVEKESGAEE